MNMMLKSMSVLVLFLAGCSSSGLSVSEVNNPDGTSQYDVSGHNVPLDQITKMIAGRMKQSVVIADDVDKKQLVEVDIQADSWEGCLNQIAAQYDLTVDYDAEKSEYRFSGSTEN